MKRSWFLTLAALLLLPKGAVASEQDGRLGSSCESEDDCVMDLTCLLPPDGFAGGLCTLPCYSGEDCSFYGLHGTWCDEDGDAYCHERCTLDEPLGSGLDSEKCHGRSDVACERGVCRPRCGGDEHCGPGLSCNSTTGLCQGIAPEGDPPGSPCEDDSSCLGLCSGLSEPPRCVEPCVIGAPLACSGSGESKRACLGKLNFLSGTASGDLGVCVDLCDCSSDCAEDEICAPWDLQGLYDARGVCQRGPEQPDAPDCLSDASSHGCIYGAIRACRSDACLGTAECLPDGTYSQCVCLSNEGEGREGGAGGEGGAEPNALSPTRTGGCAHYATGDRPRSTTATWLMAMLLASWRFRRTRQSSSQSRIAATRATSFCSDSDDRKGVTNEIRNTRLRGGSRFGHGRRLRRGYC